MPEHSITLRAAEPSDLDFLYRIENDTANWEVSNTRIPFSKNTLNLYLNQVHDIYADKQLRLVICSEGTPCGMADLFDFDPFHLRAGIGIVVDREYREQGIASQALELLKKYSAEHLGLRILYCTILAKNAGSIRLFEKASFFYTGTHKDWHRTGAGEFTDEIMYQFNFR
ncbi:MAG: GNAT family protein [Bacteroidota bacterium]